MAGSPLGSPLKKSAKVPKKVPERAPPKKPRRRGGKPTKSNQVQVAERIDAVEALMIRRFSSGTIQKMVKERFGLGPRQTNNYMARVRERWAEEASSTTREVRRNGIRKSLDQVYTTAMARQVPHGDATIPDPDVHGALRAVKLHMELDGLAAPAPKQQIEVTGAIAHAAAPPVKDRGALIAFLRGSKKGNEE